MASVTLRRRSTPRKQRLASLILENAASSRPASAQAMMLQVGYAPSTARSRHIEILSAVRQEPEIVSHLDRLKALRSKLLDRIEEEVGKADFRSAVGCFAILERSILLLEGKATTRIEHALSEEERQQLERILRQNEE